MKSGFGETPSTIKLALWVDDSRWNWVFWIGKIKDIHILKSLKIYPKMNPVFLKHIVPEAIPNFFEVSKAGNIFFRSGYELLELQERFWNVLLGEMEIMLKILKS